MVFIYFKLRRMIHPEKFAGFCLLVDAGMDIGGNLRLLRYLYRRATQVQYQPIIDMLVEMVLAISSISQSARDLQVLKQAMGGIYIPLCGRR